MNLVRSGFILYAGLASLAGRASRRASRWLAVVAAALVFTGITQLSALDVPTAHAAEPVPSSDSLRLVALTTDVVLQGPGYGALQLNAVLEYDLQTAQRASVVFFTFEDDSPTATAGNGQAQVVSLGTGQVRITALYRPRPGTEVFTFFSGLFLDEQTMLAWTATNPISLAPAESRLAAAEATAARERGDHARAIGLLTRAIELTPDLPTLYYWRADSLLNVARYDEAINDYNRALELKPDDRWSRLGRGVALLWREEFQAALPDLNSVIAGGRQDQVAAWAFRARGLARAGLNLPNAAVLDYQTYLSLVPDAGDAAQVREWIAALQG